MFKCNISVMWLLLILACYSCVAPGGGVVQLYVNRMLLQSIDSTSMTSAVSTNYFYVAGDTVDVWCLIRTATCTLSLHYDFREEIGGNGTFVGNSMNKGARMVGVRKTLRRAHDGALLTCECSNYTITVTFIQILFDGILELRINSEVLRYQQQSALHSDGRYHISYNYKWYIPFKMESKTKSKNVVIEQLFGDKPLKFGDTFKFGAKSMECFRYVARSNTTGRSILRDVTIHFVQDYLIRDRTELTVNTSHSALELYQFAGNREIYYDFNDGDSFTFNCTISAAAVSKKRYTLRFMGTESKNGSIVKQIQLSLINNSSVAYCYLRTEQGVTIRYTRITFRLYSSLPVRNKTNDRYPAILSTKPLVFISHDKLRDVELGQMVTLTCSVLTYSEADIRWSGSPVATLLHPVVEGSRLYEYIRKLTILRLPDRSTYNCTAENAAGSSTQTIFLVAKNTTGAGLTDNGDEAPSVSSSLAVEVIGGVVAIVGAGVMLAVAVVWWRRARAANAETIEISLSSIQNRRLPSAPHHDDCVNSPHEYREIAEVQPELESDYAKQAAEDPGIQNTLYYWI